MSQLRRHDTYSLYAFSLDTPVIGKILQFFTNFHFFQRNVQLCANHKPHYSAKKSLMILNSVTHTFIKIYRERYGKLILLKDPWLSPKKMNISVSIETRLQNAHQLLFSKAGSTWKLTKTSAPSLNLRFKLGIYQNPQGFIRTNPKFTETTRTSHKLIKR